MSNATSPDDWLVHCKAAEAMRKGARVVRDCIVSLNGAMASHDVPRIQDAALELEGAIKRLEPLMVPMLVALYEVEKPKGKARLH